MRNTRKSYVHFRNLSLFRIFSQFFILSRKDTENAEYAEIICPFSQFFALSHFFAILYFIAKGHGKCEIREKHISLFAAFRSFAFFRNHIFIAKERGKCEIRGNIYTFRIIFDFSRFFAIGTTLADYY